MIRWIRIFTVALFVCSPSVGAAGRDVRAWEDTITIPTYRLGPEDVNPRFYDLEGAIYYPYTEQEHLTTIKEDTDHKALYLENEYIKLVCLPDLGGKIYSVLDKTTGKEMFYRNRVIKPGLIAMRGAWIAGGVEWNAGPTGHGVTSYSPVDATYTKNDDGSATLVIGDTEHSTRTRWTVWLTLHPKRSYLDERIRIENPTDSVQTFYFWNNTAFPCNEYTRFIYPMTLGTDHGGTNFFSWPMHEGKDLTWLKNYDRPTSIFAYKCAFDFFGAYEVNEDQGVVQVANHHELVGKKAWTWGNSDDGLLSQSRLTDEDGPYIEVQSGPLETQADFGLLGPQQSIEWQEWWYPVHGLGQGYEFATKDVAVETTWMNDGEKTLELRILATGQFPDASCLITSTTESARGGFSTIANVPIDLSPSEPAILRVPLRSERPVSVRILDRSGRPLAQFQSPLPIPQMTPPEAVSPDEGTGVEALVMQGIDAEKENKRKVAREKYEAALALDAGNCDALVGLAVFEIESAHYQSARYRLQSALARNSEHGMAWYYLGAVWLGEDWQRGGDALCLDEALAAAHEAAQSLDTAALGHDLLGRIYMRKFLYADALRAFEESIERAADPRVALEHRMLALHAMGKRDEALDAAADILARDPLRILPRAVQAEWGTLDWPEAAGTILAQCGEDSFAVLEAAYEAADLGVLRAPVPEHLTRLPSPAVPLLRACIDVPGSALAADPMAYLLLAYLNPSFKIEADTDNLLRAANLSPDYVFPSRPESLPVLQYAAAHDDKDFRLYYGYDIFADVPDRGCFSLYLGNLYAGLGRIEEAVTAWEKAVALDDSLSVAHRNLGMYAWKKENDLSKAAARYSKALSARPDDQILYRDYANILIAQDKRGEAIALLERSPAEPSRRGDVTTLLAQAYLDDEMYEETLALLGDKSFSNWEGNVTTWRIYHLAHLARGKERLDAGDAAGALSDFEASLDYPENLGVGRPADPEEAESYYWKGKALAALGRTDEARTAFEASAEGGEGSASQNEHRTLAAEALEEL